jgi:hypothetical protein
MVAGLLLWFFLIDCSPCLFPPDKRNTPFVRRLASEQAVCAYSTMVALVLFHRASPDAGHHLLSKINMAFKFTVA